jgi:hypothetical protein
MSVDRIAKEIARFDTITDELYGGRTSMHEENDDSYILKLTHPSSKVVGYLSVSKEPFPPSQTLNQGFSRVINNLLAVVATELQNTYV